MSKPPPSTDLEPGHNITTHPQTPVVITSVLRTNKNYASEPVPFAGRIGGNQTVSLDRGDASNAETLLRAPDAAPCMTLAEQFDLRPFTNVNLWKCGLLEGWGSLMLVYTTLYSSLSPPGIPLPPTAQFGPFANASFLGPLIGSLANFLILTLFIFSFGAVTGAHLNPTVTLATFCARLCSFPRAVLYMCFQTGGAVLAGLLVRASYGTKHFKAGGCWIFTDHVPVKDAFIIEFIATTLLLFFAFGVGLDPRQKNTIGPALSPFLVGLALGILTLSTSFSRYGHGGASMNPARCLGAFVGGEGVPAWHWMHWIADMAACLVHGLFYWLVPPWTMQP